MINSSGKPATHSSSALPIPNDRLDDVLPFLGGISCFGLNGNGLLDAFGELDLEGIDADGNFIGALDETAAPEPDTTTVLASAAGAAEPTKRTEPMGKPARMLAARCRLSPASSPSRSDDDDDYCVSEDDNDRRDPSFRPKSKKRPRDSDASTRRPKLKLPKPQQRVPPATGHLKRGRALATAPPLIVVDEDQKDARCCRQCGTTKTGQWRAGPAGHNTLCNACGLQWKKRNAAPNAKRRQPAAAAKPRHGKNEDSRVVRKQRSDTIDID